jgi:NAD(P)-dependent dehydrogenase (short-subunit alcohol dehydrogenase family)
VNWGCSLVQRARNASCHQGCGQYDHLRAREGACTEENPRQFRQPGTDRNRRGAPAGVMGSEMEKAFVSQTPLGRAGQPGDIASVAVFLASDDSGWLTGEVIVASVGL